MIRNFCLCLFIAALIASKSLADEPTNVVFVISDDQGYGDLACNGNPIIKTPNIDHLASESSGLSDYHVAPTCSPTRCALLTDLLTFGIMPTSVVRISTTATSFRQKVFAPMSSSNRLTLSSAMGCRNSLSSCRRTSRPAPGMQQ